MISLNIDVRKGRCKMGKLEYFYRLSLCVVVFVGLSAVLAERACYAGDYLGEYCWDGDDGSFTRIGITHMGDGHLIFSGSVTDPGSGGDFPVHGNVEIIETSAVMAVVASSKQEDTVVSSVGTVVLDISTLNGTSDVIITRYEGGNVYIDLETHDLFSTPCDSGIDSDGSDKREELKRILHQYSTTIEANSD
jgi:hypothetical protein